VATEEDAISRRWSFWRLWGWERHGSVWRPGYYRPLSFRPDIGRHARWRLGCD